MLPDLESNIYPSNVAVVSKNLVGFELWGLVTLGKTE